MAPYTEDSYHDNTTLSSDPIYHDQNSKPVIGLHYTMEELLRLKPVKDDNLTEKTGLLVIIEKQPSVTFKDEKLEDVKKPDLSQGVAGVEPPRDGTDHDLDEAVLEKKKKKNKRSSGKNKREAANGFEGKPFSLSILVRYANIA